MTDAIRHFNEAFQYSLNPHGAYSPAEIRTLILVARLRGRPDIAHEIAKASGESFNFDIVIPPDNPPSAP